MRGLLQPFQSAVWAPDHSSFIVYHGTINIYVDSILTGIDLSVASDDADFGPGFYTTSYPTQAWKWADRIADKNPGTRPAVVYFELGRQKMSMLCGMQFVRSGKDTSEYWDVVWASRHRRPPRRPGGDEPFDYVCGPVARRWRRYEVYWDYDQFSFHTPAAVQLLDRARKGEL